MDVYAYENLLRVYHAEDGLSPEYKDWELGGEITSLVEFCPEYKDWETEGMCVAFMIVLRLRINRGGGGFFSSVLWYLLEAHF